MATLSLLIFKEAVFIAVLTILIRMTEAEAASLKYVSTDHVALLEIKSKITKDPQGVFRSWNDSLPFCTWQGVTCGRRHQRVTVLNLTDKGLEGSLSPYVGNLSFLRYMLIQGNQLHGSIPPEIGRLYRLKMLSLLDNSFTGEIPSNISSCLKLQVINLSLNMLSGTIPNIFTSLRMIKHLSMTRNNLTGGIPPSIGNLTSLEKLYLSRNSLGGRIPDTFNRLKNLQVLALGGLGLVGSFPSFLFNLSMLQHLNIPQNKLHGSLPSNLCFSQPYLQILEIDINHFSGFLPSSISNCSVMEIMDVSDNNFRGEVAIDFGKLSYLKWVSIGDSERSELNGMKHFDSLSNCSNLEVLQFVNIKLRGVLPISLGNFSSKLWLLNLDLNYLTGGIPSSIGNLFSLSAVSLAVNQLTGMIPESIGKLQNLQTLYLDVNHLSGIIPSSIGNLSLVTKLELGGNKLEGTIPSNIGNCKRLTVLHLYENNLRGSVPKELFLLSSLSIGLDLSYNNLSGVLPQEIGNLKVLGTLDLSNNLLSSELPSSLSGCSSLQLLKLSGNFFHGSIPEALSSLRGLEYVDLSQNNFSGNIPRYLQKMDLYHLNLSYNNFEGEVYVEGVFANESAVSVIGNYKLCGGISELHLPKCKTNDSRRSKNLSIRIVLAISLSSTVATLALVSFVLFYCCIKKKRDKSSDTILNKSYLKISYARLFKATEGFSLENLIGTGSFASVYKGVFEENDLTVAIKVLNLQRRGGFRSFMAECEALKHIRHRNLVKVVTCCSSLDFQGNDFKALVYEFMPNGSLESWLHSVPNRLDLVQRIYVIKDVACALDYLHCRCGNVVVHCDLKPSNILLDDDMVAHVGDFGLAKILSLEEVSNANKSSSSFIRGTIGYAPPEYGVGNEISTSGDIYSFGILILEMLTGKKPVDPMFERGLSLHSYAKTALLDGLGLQIVDPVLLNEDVNEKSLLSLVKIGVKCSSESPQNRMDTATVVHELFLTC